MIPFAQCTDLPPRQRSPKSTVTIYCKEPHFHCSELDLALKEFQNLSNNVKNISEIQLTIMKRFCGVSLLFLIPYLIRKV